MPHPTQATWHDFHRRLREIVDIHGDTRLKRKHYWRLLRSHPWVGMKIRDLELRNSVRFLPREDVPFELASWMSRLSRQRILSLTKHMFRAQVRRCWDQAIDRFALVETLRISNTAERIHVQRAVDQCASRARCVLTLRFKGHSLAGVARMLRLSAWETYAAWREGAQQISEILAEHKPGTDRRLP